jgi:uncharacterized protein (TIGR02302 family)
MKQADRLNRWRLAAQGVLWLEFAIRAGWIAASIVAASVGVALLGLVPGGIWFPLLFLISVIAASALRSWFGARGLHRPQPQDGERRLEQDSDLPHRPFMVLRDHPAGASADTGIWALHRARAEAALGRLRLAGPRPGLVARDPAALRFVAVLLLVAGLVVAGDDALLRLGRALLPSFGREDAGQVTVQAWLEPPAYTGMAPIFLPKDHAADAAPVEVPVGSKLSVSVTGGRFKPRVSGAAAPVRIKFHALGGQSWQAAGRLDQGGTLRVSRWFGLLGAWEIAVLPNEPPMVNWAGPPGQAGKSLELSLPWHVAQLWGVASLHASMVPADHPDLPPIDLPVALPGTPKDASGTWRGDLVANPLAGLKMDGVLIARDVSGQTGTSAPAHFTLPARVFKNGLARAIIEVRRRLALQDERPDEAAADLGALAQGPKEAGGDLTGHSGLFLNLVSAAASLREDPSAANVADVQGRLWIVALTLDGALPEASQQALDRARAELRRALQDKAQGKQNDPEVKRLMDKLAQAMAQRLADIARRAVKEGRAQPFDPHQHFSMPALDRLMHEMEEAAKAGNAAEAQRKLAQIEKLLNQLQNAKVLTPKQAQEAEEANKQQQRQMGAVQDMVKREATLMDNAQHRAPRPSALPPQFNADGAEPPPDPDQLEANEESRDADTRTQRALSRALDATKGAFGSSGGKVPKGMNDASKDMGDAVTGLMAGREAEARQAEAKAIADLQKGGKSMSQQMAENSQLAIVPGGGKPGEGGEQFGMEPGGGEDGSDRDPLGRQFRQGTGGKAADDGSVAVPDKMEEGRSRAIQEELRRREADKARKRDELDYIDRLLKPF